MLEVIFRGFIEWTYGLALECWEHYASTLLDLMRMDFSYLRERMPVIDPIMQILLAVGWALLIGNLAFQAVKGMMSGLGFEGEDPKLLFARTAVFSFLLLASPQICELCLNMTSTVMNMMELPDVVDIVFATEETFFNLQAAWLLVVVCGFIVMFQLIKLLVEVVERYFILAVLTITAPLAFGMGGSKNTSEIFTGWCRMYGSMCLLMVMSVMFLKMLLSVLSYFPDGQDVVLWIVLVISVVKVAKKADTIVTRIGLNPVPTGGPLGSSIPGMLSYMVFRMAVSKFTKVVGKTAGGAQGQQRYGGGYHGFGTGRASGARTSRGAGRGAAHYTRGSSFTQQTAAQLESQQNLTQQLGGATHSAVREASFAAAGGQSPRGGRLETSERKSVVPMGGRMTHGPGTIGPGVPQMAQGKEGAATARSGGTDERMPGERGRASLAYSPQAVDLRAQKQLGMACGIQAGPRCPTSADGTVLSTAARTQEPGKPGTTWRGPGEQAVPQPREGTRSTRHTEHLANQSRLIRQEQKGPLSQSKAAAGGATPVTHPATSTIQHRESLRPADAAPRQGRNGQLPQAVAPAGPVGAIPARQEVAAVPTSSRAPVGGMVPAAHPGTAGTTPQGAFFRQAAQSPQREREESPRREAVSMRKPGSSPARQEAASVPTSSRASVRGAPSMQSPGTAGSAPQMRNRQTARTGAGKPMGTLAGPRALIGADAVPKKLFGQRSSAVGQQRKRRRGHGPVE